MVEIRAFRSDDLDDLYRVCLATAAGGCAVYQDPKLVGHVYAAPYAVLSPRSVFVVEDAHGVGGYILGAPDTNGLARRAPRGRRRQPAGNPVLSSLRFSGIETRVAGGFGPHLVRLNPLGPPPGDSGMAARLPLKGSPKGGPRRRSSHHRCGPPG